MSFYKYFRVSLFLPNIPYLKRASFSKHTTCAEQKEPEFLPYGPAKGLVKDKITADFSS